MNTEDAKKIISAAIEGEREAHSFYESIARRAKDPSVKNLFSELAGEEMTHQRFLQELLEKDPRTLRFDAKKEYLQADGIPTPPLTPNLKPIEGLVIAIKKELEAVQMYTQLAKLSSDAEQQHLFLQLATMEKTHKAKLEEVYIEMAFPATWE